MSKNNYIQISRQLGYSFVARFSSFVLGPILIVLLTRFLTVSEYGIYSLFKVTVDIMVVLFSLGLGTFIVTKLSSAGKNKRIRYFFSLNVFQAIFLSALVIILLLFRNPLLGVLGAQQYQKHFLFMLAIVVIRIFIGLYSNYLMARKNIEFKSFIEVITIYGWTIFLAAFYLFTENFNLIHVLMAWLSGVFFTFLIEVFYLRKDLLAFFKTRFDSKVVRKGLAFGVPLFFASLGALIFGLGDRYILAFLTDASQVGIYNLGYSLTTIIISSAVVVPATLYPYMSEKWNTKGGYNTFFNMSIKIGLIIIFPCMAGLLVLRENIITLISGPDYLGAAVVIPVLIFFPLSQYLVTHFHQNFLLKEKTKYLSIIYLVAAILNILLNFLLIPVMGIRGAALATLIVSILMALFMFFLSKKEFTWNFNYIKIHKMLLASFLMGGVLYLVNPQVVWTKIMSILLGSAFYFGLLFLFKVFVDDEKELFREFWNDKKLMFKF